ncbi:MAG: Vacuolar protein-sorting-associated protein 24 [Bogoriella megaspora]|nr:MAG: Vacuolar protein-sorting-associated protein 24 [Bogoriella megaspora]
MPTQRLTKVDLGNVFGCNGSDGPHIQHNVTPPTWPERPGGYASSHLKLSQAPTHSNTLVARGPFKSLKAMQTIRTAIWGPTPEEQKRKCNSLVRTNVRKLDRDIAQLKQLEGKTKNFILQASKRAQRNPSQAKQAAQETRTFARELIRVRKQNARLQTSKAQLQSVQMQVNEAFSVRKIEGSIRASTGIMKDVNTLVRLPELTGTMRELSQELVKAGIIEEMVGDSLPDDQLLEGEDEEAETEVDKVLGEVLKDRLPASAQTQEEAPVSQPVLEEEEEEDSEVVLEQMRGRLEALKS